MRMLIVSVVLIWFCITLAGAATILPAQPKKTDKCPVCGMFVAKYPDFIAQIVFHDGSRLFFDGVKDMFKYYLNMKTYAPKKSVTDVVMLWVTDYYSLDPVDGRTAWYVVGSDVYGPMGKELIPFGREGDAREFLKDHKGKAVLRFSEITPSLLKGLD